MMIVGQPFTLECIVTAVRGINSQVDIVWSRNYNNGSEQWRRNNLTASIRNFNTVVYSNSVNISQLTTDDNSVTYECKVIINFVEASDNFTLRVIGK